jgi:hypothetical protein
MVFKEEQKLNCTYFTKMATGLALMAMVSWMDYLGDAGKRGWDAI